MCYSIFEKNFSYLSWLSLLLILDSWILSLESWSLESWFLKSWSLESWFVILEINFPLESWSVLDSILNILKSFFDWPLSFLSSPLSSSFVIIFVIIKTSLNHSWFIMKLCFYMLGVAGWSSFFFVLASLAMIYSSSYCLWVFLSSFSFATLS